MFYFLTITKPYSLLSAERKYTKVARMEPKPSESRPLDRTVATDGWNSVGGKAKGSELATICTLHAMLMLIMFSVL